MENIKSNIDPSKVCGKSILAKRLSDYPDDANETDTSTPRGEPRGVKSPTARKAKSKSVSKKPAFGMSRFQNNFNNLYINSMMKKHKLPIASRLY
mmetsp:Transcript_37091/g.42611  ORF Transcript_37091/g.42611 Transcript_37091/m.42611 type:complete len:95 (+) Transcript_37091:206-490(+)